MSKRLGTQKDRFKDSGDENATMWISAGESALDGGGVGGLPCVDSVEWGGSGGFGGGGGGCTSGGGGGGFVGTLNQI
jgi:anaplastic lymphoma kinase